MKAGQGPLVRLDRRRRRRGRASSQVLGLEPPRVDARRVDLQGVPAGPGDDARARIEELAQPGDVALQHRSRVGRLVRAPQLVLQAVGGHDAATSGDQHRQDLPRLRAADGHHVGAAAHLDDAEHVDVDRSWHRLRVLQTRLQRACSCAVGESPARACTIARGPDRRTITP